MKPITKLASTTLPDGSILDLWERDGFHSVSYTHLDVYKRQAIDLDHRLLPGGPVLPGLHSGESGQPFPDAVQAFFKLILVLSLIHISVRRLHGPPDGRHH